jgi:hypothetical protein
MCLTSNRPRNKNKVEFTMIAPTRVITGKPGFCKLSTRRRGIFKRAACSICVLAVAVLAYPATAENTAPNRDAFELDGHRAFVLAPEQAAETDAGKPWVWYAPTFANRLPGPEEDWMIERLHAAGIAIAGIDVGESYGSPKGRAAFQKLYVEMTEQRGYSKTPVLLARSRGGLMLYNWAVEHPDCVAAVAGVYPVCNLLSYPGLKRAAPAYEMTPEELETNLKDHNPVDRLAPLAKAKVPILHIQGDSDRVVPLEKNSGLLAERYRKLGGPVEVRVIEGGGHDMKRHWFESQPLTDFMIDRALGKSAEAGRE